MFTIDKIFFFLTLEYISVRLKTLFGQKLMPPEKKFLNDAFSALENKRSVKCRDRGFNPSSIFFWIDQGQENS
jgi:hypothetical protein